MDLLDIRCPFYPPNKPEIDLLNTDISQSASDRIILRLFAIFMRFE